MTYLEAFTTIALRGIFINTIMIYVMSLYMKGRCNLNESAYLLLNPISVS